MVDSVTIDLVRLRELNALRGAKGGLPLSVRLYGDGKGYLHCDWESVLVGFQGGHADEEIEKLIAAMTPTPLEDLAELEARTVSSKENNGRIARIRAVLERAAEGGEGKCN